MSESLEKLEIEITPAEMEVLRKLARKLLGSRELPPDASELPRGEILEAVRSRSRTITIHIDD